MSDGKIMVDKALASLGKGFDLTSDFRLKFCKGDAPLVHLDQSQTTDLHLPLILQSSPIPNVSLDIKCDKGELVRHQSDILDFHKMSEWFNRRSSVAGKVPSGLFNAMFGFESGSWASEAASTKCLALDGYFVELFNLRIDRYPLVVTDGVRNAVPSSWNPPELARFIEKYGTHIVVGLSIGGQDVVLVRQDKSSSLEPAELKRHLDELADQLFTGTCSLSPAQKRLAKELSKNKVPRAFRVFDPKPLPFSNYSSTTTKDGITVTCSKRGGDLSLSSHCEWLPTVSSAPDAINFSFIPITSLLNGVPGQGFLSHAINLYLRYKPPVADLESFLDFQAHKVWAPAHSDLPLGLTTNRVHKSPYLHINMMTPKLYVNLAQVKVGRSPVTGMRLFLEGMKFNRLAIHLQHLSNTSTLLQNKIQESPLLCTSSDQVLNNQFVEPIRSRQFSHVCTAPVKYDPSWNPEPEKDVAYIVTGAQLHVKKLENGKNVLHLLLLYSGVADSYVAQSSWGRSSDGMSQRRSSGILSAISMSLTGSAFGLDKRVDEGNVRGGGPVVIDSAVFPSGPPAKNHGQRLVRFVDVGDVCRGPQDSPGHWLVTGARLELEKGKVCLHVKFSLLNFS